MSQLWVLWLGDGPHDIDDEGLTVIGELTNLKRLDLTGFSGVTDQGLEKLRGLTKLQLLITVGTQITDEGRERFKASMPNLQRIRSTPVQFTPVP